MGKKPRYVFDENSKFVNPYNFISVGTGEADTRREPAEFGELTGVLRCRLITKTPVAFPDSFGVKEPSPVNKKHFMYKFMKTPDGRYMLSGSSLRGVLRNIYETITESCFITSDSEQRITKRSALTDACKPGLLVYDGGKWQLHWAKRYLIKMKDAQYAPFDFFEKAKKYSRSKLKNSYGYGCKVYFSYDKSECYKRVGNVIRELGLVEENDKKTEGYLYIGELAPYDNGRPQSKKHFESIFECGDLVEDENGKPIEISDGDIKFLKMLVKYYNDPAINITKLSTDKWYDGVEEAIEECRPVPIWFKVDGDRAILSLAAIGRISFKRSMGELLGGKRSCSDREQLCAACSLFGNRFAGGRIRVTDAICLSENVKVNSVTLKELSSPKLSYMPFYAKDMQDPERRPLSFDEEGVEIRGRKFYWHNTSSDYHSTLKTDRNSTMELIGENEPVTFGFDIYFDRITKKQLEELKWVITLGENSPDGSLCHKVGHGKPLGLGSVKMVIDSMEIREFSEEGGYRLSRKDYTLSEPLDISDNLQIEHKDELLRIMDINAIDPSSNLRITYPYVVGASEVKRSNEEAAHRWYSYNKGKKTIGGRVLPPILDSEGNDAIGNPLTAVKLDYSIEETRDTHTAFSLSKEMGTEYEVVITAFLDDSSGKPCFVRFMFDDGYMGSVPYWVFGPDIIDINDISIGDRYIVKYEKMAKNGKNEKWEIVRKIEG